MFLVKFFVLQCTSLSHTSISPPLNIRRDKRILPLNINEDNIISIIKKPNSNKSHVCDKLSIKKIKKI